MKVEIRNDPTGEIIAGTSTRVLEVLDEFYISHYEKPYYLIMDELGFMHVLFTMDNRWYTMDNRWYTATFNEIE